MTSKIAMGAVVESLGGRDNSSMPRKARPIPKSSRRPTFIKAWRKHRNGMTLAKLSERLEVEESYEVSEGQLSRIERGQQPYTQDLLEAISRVLRCEPQDLIMRDPSDANSIWSILDNLRPTEQEQRQAVEIIQAIRRTGTNN